MFEIEEEKEEEEEWVQLDLPNPTMPAIHQFVAGFSKGDAISNEARVLRSLFRDWGHASDLFADPNCIHPELRREATDVRTCSVQPDDIVLLHLSIGSPVNRAFERLRCRKAILYHNITPHTYYATFHPRTAESLRQGREEMKRLTGAAQVNMAVSRFNAAELESAGYADVKILPIVMDFAHLDVRPDPAILSAYQDDRTTILFVGRCAPNKCIDDLIRTFATYQRNVNPNSRLIHVGSFTGMEAYYGLCRIQVRNLGLRDVQFMGSVTQAQLAAFYQVADLFLSASEHEGFCIPLLESMHFHLPVLAYAAGAVPETLDGAGVLYRSKDNAQVAEMMGRMGSDPAFRAGVIATQDQRLERYRAIDFAAELRAHLAPLL